MLSAPTVSDNFSRYILRTGALPGPRYIPTEEHLESIFREYGTTGALSAAITARRSPENVSAV